uniref:Uncharacterized protein n=1 Tax=Anguilla anguilla TaxID=7936 RepID=A0A0E9RSJ4_ANGAN
MRCWGPRAVSLESSSTGNTCEECHACNMKGTVEYCTWLPAQN